MSTLSRYFYPYCLVLGAYTVQFWVPMLSSSACPYCLSIVFIISCLIPILMPAATLHPASRWRATAWYTRLSVDVSQSPKITYSRGTHIVHVICVYIKSTDALLLCVHFPSKPRSSSWWKQTWRCNGSGGMSSLFYWTGPEEAHTEPECTPETIIPHKLRTSYDFTADYFPWYWGWVHHGNITGCVIKLCEEKKERMTHSSDKRK